MRFSSARESGFNHLPVTRLHCRHHGSRSIGAKAASSAEKDQQLVALTQRLTREKQRARSASSSTQRQIHALQAELSGARLAAAAATSQTAGIGSKRSREVIDLSDRKRGRHAEAAAASRSTGRDDEKEESAIAERQQHMEDLNSLRAEVRQLKAKNEELTLVCRVCLDAPPSVLLQPCKHLCVCAVCLEELEARRHVKCPVCRSEVTSSSTGVRF